MTSAELRQCATLGAQLSTAAKGARSVSVMLSIALTADGLERLVAAAAVPDGLEDLRDTLVATARWTSDLALAVATRWAGARA